MQEVLPDELLSPRRLMARVTLVPFTAPSRPGEALESLVRASGDPQRLSRLLRLLEDESGPLRAWR